MAAGLDRGEVGAALAAAFERAAALDAPLNVRLREYGRARAEALPEVVAAYDRLVARLGAIDVAGIGPQVGEEMPPFLLINQNQKLVALADLLSRGPLVVSINRGHWCAYCRLELRALAALHAEIAPAGAGIVSIVPEKPAMTRALIEAQDLPFDVLTDVGLDYVLSLGLLYWIGPELIAVYRDAGMDLPRWAGRAGEFLPLPATFVVDTDGRVIARHIDTEIRLRMEPAFIRSALAATARPAP